MSNEEQKIITRRYINLIMDGAIETIDEDVLIYLLERHLVLLENYLDLFEENQRNVKGVRLC